MPSISCSGILRVSHDIFLWDDFVYTIGYQDVLDTEPWGFWLSMEGLTVVYGGVTLDRRQIDVLIPWESIAGHMARENKVYAALMAGARALSF